MEAFQRSKSDAMLSPIANIDYNLTTKSNKKHLEKLETLDSPNFRGMQTTLNHMGTTNSIGINMKKFSLTNIPTSISKIGSNMSTISKHPVTNYISTTTLQGGQACYTMPRETRFRGLHRKASCDSIYNMPEFKKNGLSMAQSTRQNSFVAKDKTPSSQDYVFTSIFDKNVKLKKGISISTKHSHKVKYKIRIKNLHL